MEDVNHVSVNCEKLVQVFAVLAKWGFFFPELNSFENCMLFLQQCSHQHPVLGNLYYSVVFLCWQSRNKAVHGDLEDCASYLAATVVSFTFASFSFDHVKERWDTNQLMKLSRKSWYPPPSGWLRVNLDGSLANSNMTGICGVLRDNKGMFISAFGIRLIHWDCSHLDILSVSYLGKLYKSRCMIGKAF
ncbi:hypothetical protein KFK09_029457 [Dendrobium nobile]|uniref:RNase H type-1 domain-containing protein n=1 Tax=Dendrobium nobile TaxID=94219 RepID=A0A8T3A0M2_DENNO|nr:hypothetical protein KFK09_029457 [Dendrobium nobile]